MDIVLNNGLIVLAGPTGAGKSFWASKLGHFVISSDDARRMLADDEAALDINREAFDLVHTLTESRLALGVPAIVDSTALLKKDRASLLGLAKDAGVPATLVVFDSDYETCWKNQRKRSRRVPDHIIEKHIERMANMRADYKSGRLQKEGFERIYWLKPEDAKNSEVRWVTNYAESVDVIGDIHGCASELQTLLGSLGYYEQNSYVHPEGRRVAFVGDLTDRGPASVEVLEIVTDIVASDAGFIAATGNHDWKIYRGLVLGRDISHANGLQVTLDEIEAKQAMDQVRDQLEYLFASAPAYSSLPNDLVITHGALEPQMVGKRTTRMRKDPISELALFGETGERPEGSRFPLRTYRWVEKWVDKTIVFGHDVQGSYPVLKSERVIALDTGCAFGGRLTALRWPEREFVSVQSIRPYSDSEIDFKSFDPLEVESYGFEELKAASS